MDKIFKKASEDLKSAAEAELNIMAEEAEQLLQQREEEWEKMKNRAAESLTSKIDDLAEDFLKSTGRVSEDDDEDGGDNDYDEIREMEIDDLMEGRGVIRGRNGRPTLMIINEAEEMEFSAEICYEPFDNVCDAKTARMIIAGMQPRKVVLLGGGKGKPEEEEDQQGFGSSIAAAAAGGVVGVAATAVA